MPIWDAIDTKKVTTHGMWNLNLNFLVNIDTIEETSTICQVNNVTQQVVGQRAACQLDQTQKRHRRIYLLHKCVLLMPIRIEYSSTDGV
jgi:hypothetical protein